MFFRPTDGWGPGRGGGITKSWIHEVFPDIPDKESLGATHRGAFLKDQAGLLKLKRVEFSNSP